MRLLYNFSGYWQIAVNDALDPSGNKFPNRLGRKPMTRVGSHSLAVLLVRFNLRWRANQRFQPTAGAQRLTTTCRRTDESRPPGGG
jgi:hypothetical protein